MKETVRTMKRYILWRPFIVDIRDTRLPYRQPKEFTFPLLNAGKLLPPPST